MAIFRGAADRRFARESGQRNRLDRPVVEHCYEAEAVARADAEVAVAWDDEQQSGRADD